MIVCLTSCSGSCLGCSIGCNQDSEMDAIGISYAADGCCSDTSCKTACGQTRSIANGDEEDFAGDDEIVSAYFVGCSNLYDDCSSSSYNYGGIMVGTGDNCGVCAITHASDDDGIYDYGYVEEEKTIAFGCIDGCACIACYDTYGAAGSWYEYVYEWLGI